MTQPSAKSQPINLSAAVLVGAVLAALVICGAVMGLVIWRMGDDAVARGFMAGTIASVIAGISSTLPLLIGARLGMMGLVGGYFVGSFVRATVAGGLCALAIFMWNYPSVSTLLTMAVYYLAVLLAESIVTGRVLWKVPQKQV
ncbi:MAG: hypothetical protein IT448_11090 [Phycisphaerales bacterium]|nr:hypothetical protein [Phycisphaerales bacterium]